MLIKLEYISNENTTINAFMLSKGFSSQNIYQEILNEKVLINQNMVNGKNDLIKINDKIIVYLLDERNDLIPNNDKLDIVYEDPYLLIVDKPSGMHVMPYKMNTSNNLASCVTQYFINNDIKSKIHIVNRLDKDTSGLVIICKNRYIKNLFCNIKIEKKYYALVEGKVDSEGEIKINIAKMENSNSRLVSNYGKEARTLYRLISYNEGDNTSLIEATLLTGRTHQIRLSFLSINHPLVGDKIYNEKSKSEFYLRSHYIKFVHPITRNVVEIKK